MELSFQNNQSQIKTYTVPSTRETEETESYTELSYIQKFSISIHPLLASTILYTHLFYLVPAVRRRSLIPPNLRKLRFVGIRDDRLFCGKLEEEAAIRNDIIFMKYFTRESPLLPPANQLHTCHPER